MSSSPRCKGHRTDDGRWFGVTEQCSWCCLRWYVNQHGAMPSAESCAGRLQVNLLGIWTDASLVSLCSMQAAVLVNGDGSPLVSEAQALSWEQLSGTSVRSL